MISAQRIKKLEISIILVLLFLLSDHISNASYHLQYSVFEKQNPGKFVGDVMSNVNLSENFQLPSTGLDQLRFAILPGKYQSLFSVEEQTGKIYTRAPVDRDRLCAEKNDCILNIEVAIVRPVDRFHVFPVDVSIRDINDHAPSFDQETLAISVPEDTNPKTFIHKIRPARDRDVGMFSVQSYAIVPPSDKFLLLVSTNEDGTKVPSLILKDRLDRESIDAYEFVLVAYDGGEPAKTGTLGLKISVTDSNDNNPIFQMSPYHVSVSEDAEVNTPVAHVSATDDDEGVNSELTYKFASSTRELYGNIFNVDNTTGLVRLIKSFDFDHEDSYSLTILAEDQGLESRSSSVKLIVDVIDVNSHPPVILVNSMSSSGRPELNENLPAGSFVAYVSVQDQDRGLNSKVDCAIKNPEFNLQQVHTKTYKIVSNVSFDRELIDYIPLLFTCTDKGSPALTSQQQLNVSILDLNDNRPEFSQYLYEISVTENNAVGQPLLSLIARDPDAGHNGEIVYSLSPKSISESTGRPYISVHPKSGVVFANAIFDFEAAEIMEFEVIVADKGFSVSLSSTATVIVHVQNTNDCAPKFTQPSFSFGIFENMPPLTEVGRVSAIDSDASPFNNVNYRLQPNANGIERFTINLSTGKISSAMSLDREESSVYYLTVLAIDANDARLTSSASVTIYIADKNDNSPQISFPSDGNNTVEVSVFAPVGFIITKVQARDVDTGTGGMLVYNLTSADFLTALFDVDAFTGAVSLLKSLGGIQTKKLFHLVVYVSDRGFPRMTSKADLYVRINQTVSFAIAQSLLSTDSLRSFDFALHQQVITGLGAVTTILVFLLVVAIICVKYRPKNDTASQQRYRYGDYIAAGNGPPTDEKRAGDPDQTYRELSLQDKCDGDRQDLKANQPVKDHRMHTLPTPTIKLSNLNASSLQCHQRSIQATPGTYQSTSLHPATRNIRSNSELQTYQQLKYQLHNYDLTSTSSSDTTIQHSNTDSGQGPSEVGDMYPLKLPMEDAVVPVISRQSRCHSPAVLQTFLPRSAAQQKWNPNQPPASPSVHQQSNSFDGPSCKTRVKQNSLKDSPSGRTPSDKVLLENTKGYIKLCNAVQQFKCSPQQQAIQNIYRDPRLASSQGQGFKQNNTVCRMRGQSSPCAYDDDEVLEEMLTSVSDNFRQDPIDSEEESSQSGSVIFEQRGLPSVSGRRVDAV